MRRQRNELLGCMTRLDVMASSDLTLGSGGDGGGGFRVS